MVELKDLENTIRGTIGNIKQYGKTMNKQEHLFELFDIMRREYGQEKYLEWVLYYRAFMGGR